MKVPRKPAAIPLVGALLGGALLGAIAGVRVAPWIHPPPQHVPWDLETPLVWLAGLFAGGAIGASVTFFIAWLLLRSTTSMQWPILWMLTACLLVPVFSIAFSEFARQEQLRKQAERSQRLQTSQEREKLRRQLVEQYIKAVERSDSETAMRAQTAISKAGWSIGLFDLLPYLSHPNENVQLAILCLLKQAKRGVDGRYDKRFFDRLDDPATSPEVRAVLLDILADELCEHAVWGTSERNYLRPIRDSDSAEAVQLRAVLCIHNRSWGGGNPSFPPPSPAIPLRYLKAILFASDPEGSNVAKLLAGKLSDKELYWKKRDALQALILLGNSAKLAQEDVRKCLSDEEELLVRVFAAAVLVESKVEDDRVLEVLRRGVKVNPGNMSSDARRKTAIETLSKLGAKASAAIPELAQAAKDPDHEIQIAAKNALREIGRSK